MISFNTLGSCGRLGNQLFQYAFLRSTAQRLGVKFYCPQWIGDQIFLLDDENERVKETIGIEKIYDAPGRNTGFNEGALKIADRTEIKGYFQSEKYWSDKKEEIRKWYTFKEEAISSVREKYRDINFSKSVGLHLRFGDNRTNPRSYVLFYICPPNYYVKALSKVNHKESILIFSDEMEVAQRYLKNLRGNIVYMEGNNAYEDLYLMSRCHDFICSCSTLSWWGVWLNSYNDKTVVIPKEGLSRPGAPVKANDIWPEGWIQIQALKPILNNYSIVKFHPFYLRYKAKRGLSKFKRLIKQF